MQVFGRLWMDQDATWYGGICLGPGHIVLLGDPVPPNRHSPQFSAHVCCGQTTPSGILIHQAVWPHFCGGEPGHSLTQCGLAEPMPTSVPSFEYRLDPFNRSATIHQHYRHTDRQTDKQTGHDRQRSDSIGR